jgi:hypothetical protein
MRPTTVRSMAAMARAGLAFEEIKESGATRAKVKDVRPISPNARPVVQVS